MEEHARDARPQSDPETTQPLASEGTSASTQADDAITETRVLARVPALDAVAEPAVTSPPNTDGRILGQSLSTKILLGAAVCFVAVATGSWLIGPDDSNSGGRSPAPNAPEAPLYGGDEPTSGLVRSNPPVPPIPEIDFKSQVPELPAWANASPATEEPTQVPGTGGARTSVTATPAWDSPQPTWDAPQPAPTQQIPPDIPRVSDRTPNWGKRSAPPSTGSEPVSSAWPNPATYYRSHREPSVEPNRQDVVPQRVATVPTEYRNRYPSAGQTTLSPESRVGSPPWTGRPAQPGVARLEGIIEKPSFRTTDDRARSSVH